MPRLSPLTMALVDFDVSFTRGTAMRLHKRLRVEEDYPWDSLDPSRYPPLLVERARRGWTENAFNEYGTFAVMGELLQCLAQARAPLDLWTMACDFPREEALYVELCARVAERLGGLFPMRFDPDHIPVAFDPSLTPVERTTELVERVCCVGEAFSLPMLTGAMKSATHPLTRAVLTTIVRDEASHGRLGWLYLDHVAPSLRAAERDRLGRVAAETIAQYAPLWERLESRVQNGVTSEGFLLAHVRELGWMESTEYAALARETVAREVVEPLARYGLRVPRA